MEPPVTSRRKWTWLAALSLVVLVLVAGLEIAGLLLRDRLDGRQPSLGEPPATIGEPADGEAADPIAAGPRFGPDVREVVVGSGAPPTPAAPPPAQSSSVAEPSQDAPAEKAVPPAQSPALPQEPPAASATPAPTTSPAAEKPSASVMHALQMGLFGSQRYRRAMEQQVAQAGYPHFSREKIKAGSGFQITVPVAGERVQERARTVMDASGYTYSIREDALKAVFHFEEEAKKALRLLAESGIDGEYERVEGEVPMWVVYAGPFPTADEAKRVREHLSGLGLSSYLRTLP